MADHLRAEARPAAQWSELDQYQQVAFKHILDMLGQAVDELGGDKPASEVNRGGAFRADRDSSSRIAFLSGARGTGKTTLFLSLLEATSSLTVEEFVDNPTAHQEVLTSLNRLREKGRLVWLEPLDMEMLSPHTNLLAAMLARIEDSLHQQMEWGGNQREEPGEYRPQGLLDPDLGSRNPLTQFRRLQNEIALTWEGNLQQRGGQIDPDPYAVEVIRTAHSRLNVTHKFRDALEALARHMRGYRPRSAEPL